MRLSITTFKIFGTWDLETLCRELPAAGVEGVEFRVDANHAHGVEVALSSAERQQVRETLRQAGLCACSIATGFRFHWPEADKVHADMEGTRKAIELARDVGAPRVRVFGNNTPEGIPVDDVAVQVGRALRELAPFAEQQGVDLLLEMHGDFNDWWLAKQAVTFANHRALGLVYNCDDRDLVKGSVRDVFHEVKALMRHIHFHDLRSDTYPYAELFDLLKADGYNGFMSMEVAMEGDAKANLHDQADRFRQLKGEPVAAAV